MEINKSQKNNRKPDMVDCEIINLLQKDGRISNTDIAKKIGISENRHFRRNRSHTPEPID
ncbi:MAG: AsnC family transcriptional regulator [Deltaproteobacteria bacterium]|nr:AsnC family transcriptional regulator [Deltaproteobacteria bacterium]